MNILIIDDDVGVRDMLTAYFEYRKCSVIAVGEAAPALALVGTPHQPDFILLDGSLPEIDGLQLLSMLKSQYPSIPIAMASGQPESERAADALKSGAVDYLQKPFDLKRLDKLLAQISTGRPIDKDRTI